MNASHLLRKAWIFACLAIFAMAVSPMRLWAQDSGSNSQDNNKSKYSQDSSPDSTYRESGFTIFEEMRGVESDQGQFAIADTSIGYMFNQHIAIDVGEPVFFARATLPTIQPHMWRINAGDPYGDLRLSFDNPWLDYDTVFTVTVPIHGTSILSTGRVGLDWFNHFEHSFGRLTPFVNGGVADGILDTTQLNQPFRLAQNFKTLGFVGDVEGGMMLAVAPHLRIGGSYYALLPAGDQKVYINGVQNLFLLPPNITSSNITHDRGYTAFARVTLSRYLFAEAAYVHSIPINDDAATITIGVDVRSLFGGQ